MKVKPIVAREGSRFFFALALALFVFFALLVALLLNGIIAANFPLPNGAIPGASAMIRAAGAQFPVYKAAGAVIGVGAACWASLSISKRLASKADPLP